MQKMQPDGRREGSGEVPHVKGLPHHDQRRGFSHHGRDQVGDMVVNDLLRRLERRGREGAVPFVAVTAWTRIARASRLFGFSVGRRRMSMAVGARASRRVLGSIPTGRGLTWLGVLVMSAAASDRVPQHRDGHQQGYRYAEHNSFPRPYPTLHYYRQNSIAATPKVVESGESESESRASRARKRCFWL